MALFSDFKLNKQILQAIEDLGFENPTPIQEKTIPLALAGHDVMGIAQTGTGKTAAFVIPILMKIKYAQEKEPRALILAPTRELALQIADEIKKLTPYTDIRHLTLLGGIGTKAQIEALKEGIDIIVATPGRMMDLYLKGELILKQIKTLVLDEADRMMDMGFMPQLRQILEVVPQKKQKLLFSATMPEKVIELSEEFLEFPEIVEITPSATPAETVEQHLFQVPNIKTKINLLYHFLQDVEAFNRVLVFARTKKNADNIYKFLERKFKDDEIRVIHANKAQNTRINAMEAFKRGEVRVLVSTDVSARGIDVSLVSHVINFDVPYQYEDYVHRIGRTGRALQEGIAMTFVNQAEEYHIQKIEEIIQVTIPKAEIPEEVEITETPFEEQQLILREIDRQKRKENPDFKGAFHEKKKSNTKSNPRKKKK